MGISNSFNFLPYMSLISRSQRDLSKMVAPWILVCMVVIPIVCIIVVAATLIHPHPHHHNHFDDMDLGGGGVPIPTIVPYTVMHVPIPDNSTYSLQFSRRYAWLADASSGGDKQRDRWSLATAEAESLVYSHDFIIDNGKNLRCLMAPLSVYRHTLAVPAADAHFSSTGWPTDTDTPYTTVSGVELCPGKPQQQQRQRQSQGPSSTGLTVELLEALFPPVPDQSLGRGLGSRSELPFCSKEVTELFCDGVRLQEVPRAADTIPGISSTAGAGLDMSDMLIVLTACNHINITLTALESIERAFARGRGEAPGSSDLYPRIEHPPAVLIVDDNSNDNTTDILRAMGYFVVRTTAARGVTYSWNLGYKIAKLLGRYKYVVFMNNDVLVPKGSMELLHAALKRHAVVVPTTSLKGAGHNPVQALSSVLPAICGAEGCGMAASVPLQQADEGPGGGSPPDAATTHDYGQFENFLTNPLLAQSVQDVLLRVRDQRLCAIKDAASATQNSNSPLKPFFRPAAGADRLLRGGLVDAADADLDTDFTIPSQYKRGRRQLPKFNGFLFGMSLDAVDEHGLAYDSDRGLLFDPGSLMVGQEDRLSLRLLERGLFPRIEPHCFMFHFKSLTVRAASSAKPTSSTLAAGGNRNASTTKVDRRDNLSAYHTAAPSQLSPAQPLELMTEHPPVPYTATEVPLSGRAARCTRLCPPQLELLAVSDTTPDSSAPPNTINSTITATSQSDHGEDSQQLSETVTMTAASAPLPAHSSICIGIRTYAKQRRYVRVLLHSLVAQHRDSPHAAQLGLKLFVVNTDTETDNGSDIGAREGAGANASASQDYSQTLRAYADSINLDNCWEEGCGREGAVGEPYIHILSPHFAPDGATDGAADTAATQFYGYELTDVVLERMLADQQCDWIMLTNGDNMYGSHWLDTVAGTVLGSTGSHELTADTDPARSMSESSLGSAPVLMPASTPVPAKPMVDVIAWDFVTHHSRRIPRTRGRSVRRRHQTVTVDVDLRGSVDLGSVMARSHLYRTPHIDICFGSGATSEAVAATANAAPPLSAEVAAAAAAAGKVMTKPPCDTCMCSYSGVRYLPDSFLTQDLFARDFFTLQTLLRNSRGLVEAHHITKPTQPINATTAALPDVVHTLHETLMFHQ